MFSDGAKQGGVCYKHVPDPKKNRRLRRRKPHFWTFQNSLFQFVIFQKNIFVESTHDARLEGGFQRNISENNDKTNVYCLIGAAGEFF